MLSLIPPWTDDTARWVDFIGRDYSAEELAAQQRKGHRSWRSREYWQHDYDCVVAGDPRLAPDSGRRPTIASAIASERKKRRIDEFNATELGEAPEDGKGKGW